MGTPEFAVPSLDLLIAHGVEVAAVITAPDKPQGRGQQILPSPVKKAALIHGLPVLQPSSLKDEQFLTALRNLEANLQVVVAFRMLPEVVWNMPALGTFNLHASLLPDYRGAAPIHWAIINGETETGVTTFFLQHEIDTGEIIFQEKEPIADDDTAGTLYERLMYKGAGLVLKTVQAIGEGNAHPYAQPRIDQIKPAPKIFKEMCEMNFHQSSRALYNFVRGLSPFPGAWTRINNKTYRIYKVGILSASPADAAAAWTTDNKELLAMKTQDGWISVLELQPEGKKRMDIKEFLRGNKL